MEQNNGIAIVPKEGWSWGAFIHTAGFLIGVKRYKLLWWYLLALIPIVNVIFFVVIMIYLGVKGHVIAAEGTQFANQSEYDGYVKGLDHAGKVLFFAALIIFVVMIVFMIAGFSLVGFYGSGFHTVSPSVAPYGG